jgi:hypothetical protein
MTYRLKSGIAVALNEAATTTATYASGGALGATSVVISTSNSNIAVGQEITGTGFAGNTVVTSISGTTINFLPAAIGQISGTISFKTWYRLTDHNRTEIDINPTIIEKEQRMANGTLRKFVISKKDVISTSWEFLPAKSDDIVDGNFSASWLTSFYNANVGNPIYIKITSSKHTDPSIGQIPNDASYVSASTGSKTYQVFITNFVRSVIKRTVVTDYVDINIEFTEV